MDRRAFAFWATLIGLMIGVLGNILFYGHRIGLSFPIFTVMVVTVLLFSPRLADQKLRQRNLWPLIPLLFFATMVAFRADPVILLLDILAVLALGGLTLHYLPSEHPLDEDSIMEHTSAVCEAGIGTLGSPMAEYIDAWGWVKAHAWRDNHIPTAILRGLAITIPVVIIFAALLGSADVVFGQYVDDLWEAFIIDDMTTLFGRLALIGGLAWLMTGALAYGWARRVRVRREIRIRPELQSATDAAIPDNSENPAAEVPSPIPDNTPPLPEKRKIRSFRLGIIETGMLLGSINLLFALFVLIQFTYFFGGQKNIEGYTYAEYARRGFFELVTVSVLTLGLLLALDQITIRPEKQQHTIFRGLAVFLVVLMGVMLVSAFRRMGLYEEAFGFTRLRVFVHIFIIWLGMLFVAFTLDMFRIKTNVFSLGVLLVAIGYLATLNLLNIDMYIVKHNLARFEDGRQLDPCYLRGLSMDAVPAMIELREHIDDETTRNHIDRWLQWQLYDLDEIRDDNAFFTFNWSIDRAWDRLNPLRDILPAHYPDRQYWEDCSTYVR